MSRKVIVPADEDSKVMNALEEKENELSVRIQEDDKLFLEEGEEYNLHVCMMKSRECIKQAKSALTALGRQLILIKNHEPHGNFMSAVEDLGLDIRFANRLMAGARWNIQDSERLEKLGKSKFLELTILDDKEAEALADGKELEGIGTFDDIAKMSVKELRSALREEKKKRQKERDAQEEAISQKEKKLNELEQELRYRQPPTKADIAQAKLDEKRKPLFTAIMSCIEDLSVAIDRVEDICRTDDVQLDQLTRLARSFDSEMSLLKEKLDVLDEALNAACPIKEDVPCTSNTPNK